MNQSVKMRKAQVWPIVVEVFPEYRGRKFKLVFAETVTLSDLHWGGGSRNSYGFVRADGELAFLPSTAPWDCPYEGKMMALVPEILVVEHTMFCGEDLGITIYAHPCWAAKINLQERSQENGRQYLQKSDGFGAGGKAKDS